MKGELSEQGGIVFARCTFAFGIGGAAVEFVALLSDRAAGAAFESAKIVSVVALSLLATVSHSWLSNLKEATEKSDQSATKTQPDWLNTDLNLVKELIRQAEEYLKAQLQSGIAADQRAMRFVASMIAVMAASSAAWIAWVSRGKDPASWTELLHVGVLSFEAMLLLSVSLAIRAAQPSRFHYPGNDPAVWWHDPASLDGANLCRTLCEIAENYHQMIDENDSRLRRSERWLKRAFYIAVVATPVALVATLVSEK